MSLNKGFEWSLYVLRILDLFITKEFQESLFMLKVLDFLTRELREVVHDRVLCLFIIKGTKGFCSC